MFIEPEEEFNSAAGYKHHAPNGACLYRVSESRRSAPTPALLIRSV